MPGLLLLVDFHVFASAIPPAESGRDIQEKLVADFGVPAIPPFNIGAGQVVPVQFFLKTLFLAAKKPPGFKAWLILRRA
jgi:hypothetical protein